MSQSFARSFNVALFTSALLGVSSVAFGQEAAPAPAPVTGETTITYSSAAPTVDGDANTTASSETAPTSPVSGAEPSASAPDTVTERDDGYAKLRARGIDFYFGVGGSFAGGSYAADVDTPISDASAGAVTGLLGFGYRFNHHLYLGLYVEGGVGPVNTSKLFSMCESDELSCSSGLVRYGLEGRYTFNPASQLAWWAGLGIGADKFSVAAKNKESGSTQASILAEGTEVSLKGGVNFPVAKGSTADVFIGYARGSLSKVSVDLGSSTGEVADPGSNGWLSVGAALVL